MSDYNAEHEPFDSGEDELEEAPQSERAYRSVGILVAIGLAAFLGMLVLANNADTSMVTASYAVHPDSAQEKPERNHPNHGFAFPPPTAVLSHMRPRDTVFTTDSLYLEVNLKKQNVTVHFRDGASRTFLVSSGNPAISDGIATPAGLFTVQNMVPMAISKQFNDARLHHWIGVQGGVGFHGLDGSGYYGYLGVRPSSHGCLRMSKEEIATMYKLVHPGALIMVHSGSPARVVAFCAPTDTADALLIDSAAVHNRNLGKERLRSLYAGRIWTDAPPRLVHIARQRLRWGMEIGEAGKIPKQEIPQVSGLRYPHRMMASYQRTDRLRVTRHDSDLFALAHASDSVAAAQNAQWRAEESRADYRE